MNQISELFTQITAFVLKEKNCLLSNQHNIIKHHTDKLSQYGDLGFPTTTHAWINHFQNNDDLKNATKIISENDEEFTKKLIAISSKWMFPIERVVLQRFRCLLFLNREKCYTNLLKTVIFSGTHYGEWHQNADAADMYAIQSDKHSNDHNLTEYRCELVAKVLLNLLQASGFDTQQHGGKFHGKNAIDILVTSAKNDAKQKERSNEIEQNNNIDSRKIICGSVKNRSILSADEFIQYEYNNFIFSFIVSKRDK